MDGISETIRALEDDNSDLGVLISKLEEFPIQERGLTNKDFVSLMRVIVNATSKLNTLQRRRLLKGSIFFHGTVPSDIVFSILGNVRVRPNTPRRRLKLFPSQFQVELVEWLISVYAFLEEPAVVETLYGMIFNYLEFEYIRPQIAHLLFLSTRKKHVDSLRVNRLFNIYDKFGFSEELAALLLLYQQFAPQLIFDTYPKVSPSVFAHPNEEYLTQLLRLRSRNDPELQSLAEETSYTTQFKNKLKRRKVGRVGLDYSALVTDSDQGGIPSLEKLASNLNSFKTDVEWSTILSGKRGYRMLAYVLKETESQHNKLNNWIALIVENLNSMSDEEISESLEPLKEYVQVSGMIPRAIVTQLLSMEKFLVHQKVKDYAFWFLRNLNSKFSDELKNVSKAFECTAHIASLDWNISYIHSLTVLIDTWTNDVKQGTVGIVSDMIELFQSSILHVSTQLRKFEYDRRFALTITDFIKSIHAVPLEYLSASNVVLPQSIVYPLLFISDSITFSEVCNHLNFSNKIIRQEKVSDEVTKLISLHNSYVVDICNLIWRNKAFDTTKSKDNSSFGLSYEFTNALENNLPIFDVNSSFRSLLNLHYSPAFSGHSAQILRKIEDNHPEIDVNLEGPLSQQSVEGLLSDLDVKWLDTTYDTIRVEVLEELSNLGYTGVADLLFSHLRSLVKPQTKLTSI